MDYQCIIVNVAPMKTESSRGIIVTHVVTHILYSYIGLCSISPRKCRSIRIDSVHFGHLSSRLRYVTNPCITYFVDGRLGLGAFVRLVYRVVVAVVVLVVVFTVGRL